MAVQEPAATQLNSVPADRRCLGPSASSTARHSGCSRHSKNKVALWQSRTVIVPSTANKWHSGRSGHSGT
jgi:hypothetical protein